MSISMHSASVPIFVRMLVNVNAWIGKAEDHAAAKKFDTAVYLAARLAPDMLPFGYQVKSCAAHSIGGIEGVRAGSFTPDRSAWPTDFAGLHDVLKTAVESLKAIDRESFDDLIDSDTQFEFGEMRMPFTGANFLLSFSQPNFYFHATTAYAILRAQGVKLGKQDFMGRPRIKR